MVIVKLKGGLGNQLFQYALGLRLALERDVPLKLDLSWFSTQTLRQYRLDQYNIKAEIAGTDEVKRFTHLGGRDLISRIFNRYQSSLPYYKKRVVTIRNVGFDPLILKVSKKVHLAGYWQSEQYFKPIEDTLRHDFQLKHGLVPEFQHLAAQIQSSQSISLHIRRGDYVSNVHTKSVHGTCSVAYYQSAVEYIRSKVLEPQFFIFSDDPMWVEEKLVFVSPSIILPIGPKNQDVQHLYLMSLCKHHIIANSTFSWWGSWLGDAPGKLVIAPNKWFQRAGIPDRDIVPENWIKM